jgi:Flp pilus assembly protein TadG
LEFAVVGSLAFMLMFGVMEAARYQFTQQALRSVAGEAARQAMLLGAANMAARRAPCAGLTGTLAGATFSAPFLDASALSIQLSGCATLGAVTLVTVTVTHPFAFLTPLIQPASFTLTEATRAFFN